MHFIYHYHISLTVYLQPKPTPAPSAVQPEPEPVAPVVTPAPAPQQETQAPQEKPKQEEKMETPRSVSIGFYLSSAAFICIICCRISKALFHIFFCLTFAFDDPSLAPDNGMF